MQRARKALVYTCITTAAVFTIRSPTIFFFFATGLIGDLLLPRLGDGDTLLVPLGRRFAQASIVLAFVLPPVLVASASAFGGMAARIVNGNSFTFRQAGPMQMALLTLEKRPLFGFGVGANQSLHRALLDTYGARNLTVNGVYDLTQYQIHADQFITNGFWDFWIIFGLIPGALLIYLLGRLIESMGAGRALFPLFAIALTTQTISGVTGIWPVFYLFTFIAIARQRADSAQLAKDQPPTASRHRIRLK
jgi:hypothetical protein